MILVRDSRCHTMLCSGLRFGLQVPSHALVRLPCQGGLPQSTVTWIVRVRTRLSALDLVSPDCDKSEGRWRGHVARRRLGYGAVRMSFLLTNSSAASRPISREVD